MGMSSKSKPQGKQVNLFPEKGENYEPSFDNFYPTGVDDHRDDTE